MFAFLSIGLLVFRPSVCDFRLSPSFSLSESFERLGRLANWDLLFN
jgi:hypothetical protein